jgi:hypothetical protein
MGSTPEGKFPKNVLNDMIPVLKHPELSYSHEVHK